MNTHPFKSAPADIPSALSGAAMPPDQATHNAVATNDETVPVGVYTANSLNMPHLMFVDWSAPTIGGAGSGIFTVNLSKNTIVRTRSHPTIEGVRNVFVTCGDEDVAAIEVTREAAGQLHHDLWDEISSATRNYAVHREHYEEIARQQRASRKKVASDSAKQSGSTGPKRVGADKQAGKKAESAKPRASAPVSGNAEKPRTTRPMMAAIFGVLGYVTLLTVGGGAYLVYASDGGGNATPPTATEQSGGESAQSGSADNDNNGMWNPES